MSEVDATDAAVRLAEEENVDLTTVEGTGTDGKITVDDVKAALETIEEKEEEEEVAVEEPGASQDPALTDPEGLAIATQEGTVNDASAREETGAQGDVDVATVPQAAGGTEEFIYPISSEDWVVLGSGDSIPERVRGRRASIVDAPRDPIPVGSEADVSLTVRVRDETDAILVVPLSEVTLDRGGRQAVKG